MDLKEPEKELLYKDKVMKEKALKQTAGRGKKTGRESRTDSLWKTMLGCCINRKILDNQIKYKQNRKKTEKTNQDEHADMYKKDAEEFDKLEEL